MFKKEVMSCQEQLISVGDLIISEQCPWPEAKANASSPRQYLASPILDTRDKQHFILADASKSTVLNNTQGTLSPLLRSKFLLRSLSRLKRCR